MRRIEKLNPVTRVKAERFLVLCEAAGYPVKILDTLRTETEQNAIPAANTNAKYPNSMHNWGLAFDFCRNIKGREFDNSDKFYEQVSKIGKECGLFWGGDFKSLKGDLGHLEDQNHGTISSLISRWGTPEMFIKAW
jgi:hypothetical protein